MIYANNINGTITRYNILPKDWNGEEGFQYADQTKREANGFYELVIPAYDSETQYLGQIIGDIPLTQYTYEVIDKTDEEIRQQILDENKIAQDELIKADIKVNALISAQSYSDDEALNSQALYPQWVFPFEYTVGFKVQDFVGTELKLYKNLQAHTSQSDWKPNSTPALWLEVAAPGVIPLWVQPTGAHDAYSTGAKVHYPTLSDSVYESTVNANVYAPGVVSGQWIEV